MVKPLVSPALLARGFGKGTDFEVYTGAATADESLGRPIVRMIGSSTVKDLQGDIMTITALEDMTKIDPEMTIWLNHRYEIPDDVFGKLAEQPAIQVMGGIADLHLGAEADFSRPVSKARDVYTQISKGKIRQGCSIGCQVLDYSFADSNDPYSPILIHHVYTVEFSIVGIPANQRAWIENAVKGLFSRALVEGRGEDALRLAPAMKSMFWRDYDATLRYIETKSLRTDLEQVRERGASSPRIIFNFDRNKGFEGFALLGSEETLKPLTFAETQDLLNTGVPGLGEKDEKSLLGSEGVAVTGVETLEIDGIFYVKSADGTLTPWVSKEADGILDTDNGGELIRQDLEDEVDEDAEKNKASGIHINEDGSHEKMTGKHTHKHPNYGNKADGDMHSHSHEHQDDANHHHSHDDEKSAEEEPEKQADVTPGEEETDQKHLTLNNEQRTVEELEPIVDVVTQSVPTPEQLAYLSLYNDLGKRLGFPEHTLATKCNLVDNSADAQSVISAVSTLDGCADTLFNQAYQVSSTVDMLMSLMKIPNMDGMGAYASLYSLERAATSLALTVKEGKEISGKNASLVQSIHDTAAALHPACCRGVSGDGTAHQSEGTTVQDAQAEARAMGQGQGYDSLASLNAVGITMKEFLAKSFEGLNVKSLVEQKVNDAVDVAMTEARANLELLNREQQAAMHNVARLKNVPLGRPTQISGRTVVPKDDERVATYEEMLSAGGVSEQPGTLKELEAYTEIVEKDIFASGGGKIKSRYRHWPESVGGVVGGGLRPPLTGNQKSLMLPAEWSAYNLGAEVDVPLIDDPFVR